MRHVPYAEPHAHNCLPRRTTQTAHATVDPALVDGKVLIGVLNVWEPIGGHQPLFEVAGRSSREGEQAYFAGAREKQTFNHVGFHELEL